MKTGLRLSSFLILLPLVVGTQNNHPDSLYTDLTMGIGGGSYAKTFYTRHYTPGAGCAGGKWTYREHREKINYQDAGVGIESKISKRAKLGLRAGYIQEKRVKFIDIDSGEYKLESTTSYILNPHFSYDWNYFGFGLGVVGATKGIHYPSLRSPQEHYEDYLEGKDIERIIPSYHLRLGNPKHIYASVSHLENIPLISGGGYINYGVGTEAIPSLSLWLGSSGKKPFEKESFLVKIGVKLSGNWSLYSSYHSGESNGRYIQKPIKEKGLSLKLNYRFHRK